MATCLRNGTIYRRHQWRDPQRPKSLPASHRTAAVCKQCGAVRPPRERKVRRALKALGEDKRG